MSCACGVLLSCVLLLVPPDNLAASTASIVINEVYYDHPGRDDGHEFVELINRQAVSLRLDGWSLELFDGAGGGRAVLWRGTVADTLAPGALFVVGGGDVVPPVDAALATALQNGPDAVLLLDSGDVVDRVGYGALSDPTAFEGSPAADVVEGRSLARLPDGVDTENNSADFHSAAPTAGGFNEARYDVALTRGFDTPRRRAVAQGAVEAIHIRAINRGARAVAAGSVSVVLVDSTRPAVLDSARIVSSLAAGDSMDVAFDVTVGSGYLRLTATARYARDERSGNDAVDLIRRGGDPGVIVSEVMSHPRDGCPEYVEVFNAGTALFNLSDTWLRDAVHAPAVITPKDHVLMPGAFAVLTVDAAALLSWFGGIDRDLIIDIEGAWPSFNHSGGGEAADSVIVLDRFLLPLDAVAYPPQPISTRGSSIERVDLYPGHGSHTWTLSSASGGGTPGRMNSRAVKRPPRRGIVVSPNPFDPSSGEALVVTISARPNPSRAVVHLFDTLGRRLADIGTTTELPFVFLWDGRDDRGEAVTSGVYVLACEFFTMGSGQRHVEKVVVGCAKKRR